MRSSPVITLDTLRRRAASQSLFRPASLGRALEKLAFVRRGGEVPPRQVEDAFSQGTVKN